MLFSPAKGWTNDPNGLIQIEDEYHLFFQYYPDDIKWGPMHWGHAISKDLNSWQELPVAIYPDEAGYIFSGSAMLDAENVSGLGDGGKAPLLCFYTLHNPDTGEQQQCIAYSRDYMHFTKYAGNPVITNRLGDAGYRKDFRDPKVFRNTVCGGYSMVLAAGEELEFYHSENMLDWAFSGSFPVASYLGHGICECPDCFCIDGTWVLSLSYIPTETAEEDVRSFTDRHTMNYFVGSFDGACFRADEGEDGRKLLDFGPDNYAMVTFADSCPTLMLGWAESWDYVYDIPAGISRGKMTSARKITLRDTRRGRMLSQRLLTDTGELTLRPGETVTLGEGGENSLTIGVDEEEILVTRGTIPGTEESRWLGLEGFRCFRAPRLTEEPCTIRYAVNGSFYEITAEDGCIVFSVNI